MKKILNILSFALLLGGCSSFLEEYSQDLAKIEGVEDLDEILLGEAYLPFSAVTDLGNTTDMPLKTPVSNASIIWRMSCPNLFLIMRTMLPACSRACSAGIPGRRWSD